MRKITSFLLSMILALVAIPIQAAIQADVVIDQEFSSLAELEGKAFAIVNKETGKALFGTNNQNLGYDVLSVAFSNSNSGYYFKLDAPVEDPEDASIAQCHLLRLQTPAGEGYNIWGNPGYLNSQPSNGSVSFILGLNNQNGQDIKNGAVFDIQYVEGKGFTLLNKGTGLYLNDNAPAKYEEPVYWTFCTLKKDWMTAFKPLFDEEAAIKACGTSEEANAAYDAIVDPIKAKVESGNIADAEADLATIDAALTDLAKAQTKAGADFTRVIVNPEINGADGWTIEKPLGGNGPLFGGSSFEYWAGNSSDRAQASFDYYQVISGLVNGAYTVTADMYNSLNGEEGATWNATSGVYGKGANESVTLVNEDGMTLKPYTTGQVFVVDGTIRIGVKNTVTPMAARWFVADNFKLKYVGPAATEEELAPLTAEIANAKLLGVDVSAWEGKSYVASEIEAAVNEIKVAEYKSVLAAYPFNAGSLIPAFDAWEGGMASNQKQHWDGTSTSTYYEQAGNQWGQASWTNSKTTTVNLPKGKYVIYAAGRNSAGTACTSYIKVNDKTQIFPAKGDTGFGIATDGTATFDPSATYANNNAGRGWEYRYIAFEVTAEEGESVTLTVGGEATAEHQWMSVCVPVLLTTSDNVAIAKQTLAADITAAQAIVDAKAGVGEGLFLIPEEAFSTFSAAVEAAKAVNDNAEATGEEVAAAIAALAAATKTYNEAPVNAPAADKQYTLTLYAPDGTELFPLSIVKGKISIEEVGTPITFVAKEGGKYALSNGTEEIYYSGSNNWDLDATTEGGYAWSISALDNGKYHIEGKLAGRYLGTNNAEKAAGSKCYGDKKTDANVQWTISEYVAPAPVLVYTDLAVEDYYTWSAADATGEKVNQCPTTLVLNESTGLPFGDGNVHYLNYVDLSDAVNMVVTATDGTPRMLFNRVEDNGTVNVELPRDAQDYWTEVDNGDGSKTYTVDVKKIVANFGFAHLHCIKGANWANTTVTSVKIGREEKAPVEPTTYAIAIAEGIENGTIAADVETAEEGATVTLTATPAEGYKLETITVTAGEASVEVTEAEGAYTFVMPAAAVTVSATFAAGAVEPTPDPNLIKIAQTVDADENLACEKIEGEEYTQYNFAGDISVAFKMLNVDVKDCDYVVIKFAEPTPAGISASFFNGQNSETIPEGVTEWKNVLANNTTVVDGVLPQITLLTIFTGAGKSVKVEGVYKHKVAAEPIEPELATINDMKLSVEEGALFDDKTNTFPVQFTYVATINEEYDLPNGMPSGEIAYTITTAGKEPVQATVDFQPGDGLRNIPVAGLEYKTEYTLTINSITISSMSTTTWETTELIKKTFGDGELTITFTSTVPTSINGVAAGAKSNRKVVENGRVVIYKNGVKTMSSGVSIR